MGNGINCYKFTFSDRATADVALSDVVTAIQVSFDDETAERLAKFVRTLMERLETEKDGKTILTVYEHEFANIFMMMTEFASYISNE